MFSRRKTFCDGIKNEHPYWTSSSNIFSQFVPTENDPDVDCVQSLEMVVQVCLNEGFVVDEEDLLAVQDRADLLEGLGHIEAHIGHLVVGHLEDHGQHMLSGDVLATGFRQ